MFIKKINPFSEKVYLSSPTMHGDELRYMQLAYETNWMSTVGENINEVERIVADKIGCKYAVALSCGTAALHLCMKLAGIQPGDYVFATDMTFDATVNPIVYEGGVPVFIDTEYDTWNMDPVALEKAFELYRNTKVVVCANLYGTPGKLDQISAICQKHNAILIEDAAESLGATFNGAQTGTFGKYNAISFNGNKIITGSSGGMLLTDDLDAANKARKWSTQSREAAPWYQHEEIGYNYRMSNVIAGVVRGQLPYLEEHIAQKKAIYERYKEGFKDLPVSMNPIIDNNAPCQRGEDQLQGLPQSLLCEKEEHTAKQRFGTAISRPFSDRADMRRGEGIPETSLVQSTNELMATQSQNAPCQRGEGHASGEGIPEASLVKGRGTASAVVGFQKETPLVKGERATSVARGFQGGFQTSPNYWLSCLLINPEAMCHQVRSDSDYCYTPEHGKTCPQEILDAISSINAEGRPIWKPMHMQPVYMNNPFVTINGNGRAQSNAYIDGKVTDVGKDIFRRGLCLPSDNKMTPEQQDRIIEVIKACFE